MEACAIASTSLFFLTIDRLAGTAKVVGSFEAIRKCSQPDANSAQAAISHASHYHSDARNFGAENRQCDQAIIVFDRSSIVPSILKVIGNIAFRPQYGFIVVVDSLRGDYQNLGLAYLLARDMASADKKVELETDLLLILMDRIVSEANRLLEIRSLVEDGIKKSQDVISRLEQGSLSMDRRIPRSTLPSMTHRGDGLLPFLEDLLEGPRLDGSA